MALTDEEKLDQAVAWLRDADALLITAGAGMGVDSGLPAFRGRHGLWKAWPALKHLNMDFARISTEIAIRKAPRLAWGFHGYLLQCFRGTHPHKGFQILLHWARQMEQGYFVFTSNVDGAFQKAGYDRERIMECHGSLHYLQCIDGCDAAIWPADDFQPVIEMARCQLLSNLPTCPRCGQVARPNMLLFDDPRWIDTTLARQREHWTRWRARLRNPVVVELGAGKAIPTVRHFSEQMGRRIIRINPHDFRIASYRGVGLAGPALGTLQALDARLNARQSDAATGFRHGREIK
ncbi:SIR2 family NAD-dependent protein deacylase [Paraburkholderia dinghuensis]|uniref:SIR2 family NAD-dependent protein deacylase n=1 Tax=Paraburkholderia dinghuensis TaxID=2305225 RepID=UPI00162907A1|nr:Sir2 family NAD-dependent protein deacetylase [Paraburkholderia dinghuensis]